MSLDDYKPCTACYFVERAPAGTHPMWCRREQPSVRTSDARAPGGCCEGGCNWLRNHRAAPIDHEAADGAID